MYFVTADKKFTECVISYASSISALGQKQYERLMVLRRALLISWQEIPTGFSLIFRERTFSDKNLNVSNGSSSFYLTSVV